VLTVACVLRSGKCYDAEYVRRLRHGVVSNLSGPYEFVCLSDVDVPCKRIPLTTNWPGWWAKMELFKLPGPVLYFDLDTVIAGDLSEIAAAAQTHPLIVLRDFYRTDGFGSGMMGWNSDLRDLHDKFGAAPDQWRDRLGGRGDQGFIEETVDRRDITLWQDLLPGQVVSYKVHVRDKEFPPDARVVCFHGRPKPHEVNWCER